MAADPDANSRDTPGSMLGNRLASCDAVRAVYERHEPDRYGLFVILDSDDEAVLDLVFECERDLLTAFPKVPFDLRVMRPSSMWEADPLRASSTVHHEQAGGVS
jgi:hypothetical protein